MTLRGRLTVMAAAIVGVILTVGAVICFVVMRAELRSEVDDSLRAQTQVLKSGAPTRLRFDPARLRRLPAPPPRFGGAAPYTQLLDPAGRTRRFVSSELRLPVSAADRAVASGARQELLRDQTVSGVHLRVITVHVPGLGAVQLARSLASVDKALSRLRAVLIILVLGGTLLAIGLSRLFARSAMTPIRQLTEATEHIEATGDLGRRVPTRRRDEVGRLAERFNGMLDRLQQTQQALESSTAAQRQLVADASHELRTPIASLRTNIEVLLAGHDPAEGSLDPLLQDIVEQTEELSAVVSDLIELARGDMPDAATQELELDAIVREAMVRAQRHAPRIEFTSDIEPWAMNGAPERIGRAINNVVDNAAKFSPPGSRVEVRARGGTVTVRDHGPGVAREELPHIFDRFYRSRVNGHINGSGLGLAIVKQVVESHGGSVGAAAVPGGGLEVTLRFGSTDDEEASTRTQDRQADNGLRVAGEKEVARFGVQS